MSSASLPKPTPSPARGANATPIRALLGGEVVEVLDNQPTPLWRWAQVRYLRDGYIQWVDAASLEPLDPMQDFDPII